MRITKFYVTTPIYYVNDVPSVGSSYTTIAADVIARWHRISDDDVFFLTGLDENSSKTVKAAEKADYKDIQKFTDDMAKKWLAVWERLNISYNDFIRTTEERHKKTVREVFMKIYNKGDIYKGNYLGLYCEGCEAFYVEKDLVDGVCPFHKTKPKQISEENYFFKLANYKQKLLDYIKSNPGFIQPKSKEKEVISFVKHGLKDISISRPNLFWGIDLPIDKNQKFWVWLDALFNYITAENGYWPADIHLLGKDILRFHAIIWPALLMSSGYKLPKTIYAHGFFTVNGQKMSKSLGNVIDPVYISDTYTVDSLRYYLMREIPFGEDGNFSEKALVERYNNELANELGNLLQRTLKMIEKYNSGKIPKAKTSLALAKQLNLSKIKEHMNCLELHFALAEIFSFVSACNKYINDRQPWKLSQKERDVVLYSLADSLRIIAILLHPFIPFSAHKISQQLGVKCSSLKECKFNLLKPYTKIGEPEILFQKIEFKEDEKKAREISVSVGESVKQLGLKVSSAVVENVKVKKKHEGLEKLKEKTAREWVHSQELEERVRDYERVYSELSVSAKNSVRNLFELVEQKRQLPQINTAVDCYNVVSLSHAVVVGGHDLDKLFGNVRFDIALGNEHYIPLGTSKNVGVARGEFAVLDERQVICRLDEKQSEQTKIDNSTRNIFLYVQGNKKTTDAEVKNALKEICGLIVKYCGGKYRIL